MSKLSDKLSGLTYVPKPQSPQKAGMIQPFAGSVAPEGWHLCDGSVLEQADYADLFANIGSTWDTFAHPVDGTPTVGAGQFALPNLKGLYLAGSGDAGGDARALGVYQADEFKSHSHGSYVNSGSGFNLASTSAGGGAAYADTIPTSTSGGTETRPKTAPITYIIKLYDDTAGTSLSQVPASASARGVIQLSSEFAAGNGAYGLVEADRSQTKLLASDFPYTSVKQEITGLTYDQLVIGEFYEIKLNARFGFPNTTTAGATIEFRNGPLVSDTLVGSLRQYPSISATEDGNQSVLFKATDATLTFWVNNNGTQNGSVRGNGSRSETFVTVTERKSTIETTDLSS